MNKEQAWTIYKRKGVIVPGYQDEIAERRRVQEAWSQQGEQLG